MKLFKKFIVVAVLGYGLLVAWFWEDIHFYLQTDACMDAGGRWDYEKNICDKGDAQGVRLEFPVLSLPKSDE